MTFPPATRSTLSLVPLVLPEAQLYTVCGWDLRAWNGKNLPQTNHISTCLYNYIYILYTERERDSERDIHVCICEYWSDGFFSSLVSLVSLCMIAYYCHENKMRMLRVRMLRRRTVRMMMVMDWKFKCFCPMGVDNHYIWGIDNHPEKRHTKKTMRCCAVLRPQKTGRNVWCQHLCWYMDKSLHFSLEKGI